MTELTIGLLMIASLLSLLDWRKGLVMCVVVGIAQDPLRKLAPNQPVYYVVLVCVIFAAAWVRAALLKVPLGPSAIHGWRKGGLAAPATVFFALVSAQALHSYVRYGSAVMTFTGLLVWLAPVPAVMLAYQFATRAGLQRVRSWMKFYVVVAMLGLSGVYLEYIGFESALLGEIGAGQLIFDVGTVLKAHSGFFRASEIAAWHTAAVACFIFILAIGKRFTLSKWVFAVAVIAVLVGLGILTGRRKMLVEITVFLSTYFFFVAWLERGAGRLAALVLAMGVVGYIGIVGFVAPDLVQESYSKRAGIERGERLQGYVIRGQSVFVDLPSRVNALGVQPVSWALDSFGLMGAGLGTGSQGAAFEVALRHGIDRGPAEGGLGKITMELGLPGLFIVGWLVWALGRHLKSELIPLNRMSPHHARIAFGFLAFLVANAANFSVATQAYSDPFALLILGWCLGFLLAIPVLAARSMEAARQAAAAQALGPTVPGHLLGTRGPNPLHSPWVRR